MSKRKNKGGKKSKVKSPKERPADESFDYELRLSRFLMAETPSQHLVTATMYDVLSITPLAATFASSMILCAAPASPPSLGRRKTCLPSPFLSILSSALPSGRGGGGVKRPESVLYIAITLKGDSMGRSGCGETTMMSDDDDCGDVQRWLTCSVAVRCEKSLMIG